MSGRQTLVFAVAFAMGSLWSGPLSRALANEPSHDDILRCHRSTSTLLGLSQEQEKSNDPRLLFTTTHYLISSRLSELVTEGAFERPDLISRMNEAFVDCLPGVAEDLPDHWQEALRACGHGASPSTCAEAMARAHIQHDLEIVMNRLPCVPQDDWDRVYRLGIVPSIGEAIDYVAVREGKESNVFREFVERASKVWVRWERDAARLQSDCGS